MTDARVLIEAGAIATRYGYESWASVAPSDQFYFFEQAWWTRMLNIRDQTPNYGDPGWLHDEVEKWFKSNDNWPDTHDDF